MTGLNWIDLNRRRRQKESNKISWAVLILSLVKIRNQCLTKKQSTTNQANSPRRMQSPKRVRFHTGVRGINTEQKGRPRKQVLHEP